MVGSSAVKLDTELDFEAVFNSLPSPFMILNGKLEIVAMNQAYLDLTKRSRESLLGMSVFAAFPAEGESLRTIKDSFERVRSQGIVDIVPMVPYSIPVKDGFEQRYWSCTHVPIKDKQGKVAYVLKNAHDITHLETSRDLPGLPPVSNDPCRDKAAEPADAVHMINQSLLATVQHLRGLFLQAPNFMCVLRGPEHIFEMANLAFQDLTGARDLIGKPLLEGLPEAADQEYRGILDNVFETGEAYVGRKVPVFLKSGPNGEFKEHFLDFVCQPIVCENSLVSGVFVEGTDVTDHVRAEQRQALLIRELHHRVRNTLATVQGLMNTTAKSSATVEDFQTAFAGRIASLANTHAVLTDELEQCVSFRQLLNQELSPYFDEQGLRVRLKGVAVDLPSQIAVPLGMAVHELTTNAAKHGALAAEEGRIEVEWCLVEKEGGRAIAIDWREFGGPAVKPPGNDGFGSTILKRVLAQQIGAEVKLDFAPEGFRMRMTVPLDPKR
jgi:PAS domain S-box-containing protein